MSLSTAPPEARAATRVGTVLAGKYGIERLLGAGGMAAVYAGVHRNGRRVAIKLLHHELSVLGDIRARFVREGYVANAVGHPGAVHVFDDDVADDGSVFLVMELLEGETLGDRCHRRGGTLPCREVLALAHQLLDVLAAAHARGIIHRDIKPENLFLTMGGALKVLDFGVARMRDDAGAHVTATGMRIGTPAFMPPEQALGRAAEIDARTDLWAAGATMFALLAGRTVHTAPSAAELIVITATTPPRSLSEHAPDVPPAVVALVDRAVAFSRDERWPDARAMQRALEEAHLAAFGEPLDPAKVGPPPEPRAVAPRMQDELETVPLRAVEVTTLPARPVTASATRPATASATPPTLPPLSSPPETVDPSPETMESPPPVTVESSPPGTLESPRPGPVESPPRGALESSPPGTLKSPLQGPLESSPRRALESSPRRALESSPRGPLESSPRPGALESSPRGALESSPPPPGALPSTPAPPLASDAGPASARRRWPLLAAAVAAVAAGSFGIARWTAAPPPPGPPAGSAQHVISSSGGAAPGPAAPGRCARNADCKGAAPAICRKDDGVCVPLENDQCKVLASPGDVEDDATIWIGAMFPISMPDPDRYGPRSGNAVELARRDFATMTGGLLPVRPGAPKRPIAVVLCDDREAPEPAARHLVEDLRVPAVLGFALSKEVMQLSTSLFNPKGVLALAANTASALRDIPPSPSGERLVWRVTTSADMNVPVIAAVVSEVLEPAIRARPGVLAPGEPMRAVFVRVGNTTGQSYADALAAALRFNGKTVAENGDRFRQLQVPESDALSPAEAARVAAQIAEFAPHLVLYVGCDTMPPAVERAWPSGARFRPWHFNPSSYLPRETAEMARASADFRGRYVAADGAPPRDLVTRFVLHYNEVFSPPMNVEDVVSAPYDAFYLFAYAAAALGAEPITGPALARAIARLQPGGAPVDVGPGSIYQALYALADGKRVDLRGAMTTLDFDVRTGDATTDHAVYCVAPPPASGPVALVESGLFFRAATGKLEGARRCP